MPVTSPLERRPKTISEFCAYYGFSRPTFYGMVRNQKAPKILQIGERGRLITPAAEDEWLKAHTYEAHMICQISDLDSEKS